MTYVTVKVHTDERKQVHMLTALGLLWRSKLKFPFFYSGSYIDNSVIRARFLAYCWQFVGKTMEQYRPIGLDRPAVIDI